MIHPKISSPVRTPQRKKRLSNSGRSLVGSAKTIRQDSETIPIEPVPVRYSDLYKREKAQAEMGIMFKKKKSYPIAPDGLIPNSSFRMIFREKETKPIEIKAFQLRLDILENLQKMNQKNFKRNDDDDDWTEIADPDAASKPTSAKKTKGTLVARPQHDDDDKINNIYWNKNTIPDLFKRMQNEAWWKQSKDEKLNLKSMLIYLIEILKLKQIDSYEPACSYIGEIFRTYGMEPTFLNQILDVLLGHLTKTENDQLDICTIRAIAQFMIERKDIIVRLLEYALKCESNDQCRVELVNAVKFITDVNNLDEIDLVLDNMSAVYNTPEEDFSLKMVIKGLQTKTDTVVSEIANEDEEESEEVHPLLKKISEERWFPHGNLSLTLDFVLDAIIEKLADTSKTMVKTLTTHLIQLHRLIGYSTEQFDRVSNALISLLAHTEADYRLIAGTTLANLERETKAIDIALLNSFLNDPRILVRTECCDSLKKLTGIMSDTVLKDCADEISYLQTLPEENFSLQNYLKEKNRLPTPPAPPVSVEEQSTLPIEENINEEESEDEDEEEGEDIPTHEIKQNLITDQVEIHEDIPTHKIKQNLITDQIEIHEDIISINRSPSPQIIDSPKVLNTRLLPLQSEPSQVSITSSVSSSKTHIQPSIPVEINEKHDSTISHTSKSRKEQTPRQNKQPISPIKTPVPAQINRQPSSLSPLNLNMWDSYEQQNETIQQREDNESELGYFPAPQSTLVDQEQHNVIETLIEDHRQTVGFYRIPPNRPVLIPHKITMDNIFGDQSHILINRHSIQFPKCSTNSMNLSNLNHNQYQLREVEFVQLLSSLVIRAIQVHIQYEKFIPGLNAPAVTNALNVSPMPLNSSSNFQQSNVNSSSKLPEMGSRRLTTRQFIRMQSNVQAKARKEGINVRKAQHMQGVLSNLLKINREPTKSTINSSSTSHVKHLDITHAWLLIQLLKSEGIFDSGNYIRQIAQAYPKFIPLLNTRIPKNLISIIWNDPVMKRLAAIFGNKQEQSTVGTSSIRLGETQRSVFISDDENSSAVYDYLPSINHDDQKKKFLPNIHGSKINVPRHVLKFGFRELKIDSPDPSYNSGGEEPTSTSRKRRVYMHIMTPTTENNFDRYGNIKNEFRQMNKTEYEVTTYVPIVTRPPVCH